MWQCTHCCTTKGPSTSHHLRGTHQGRCSHQDCCFHQNHRSHQECFSHQGRCSHQDCCSHQHNHIPNQHIYFKMNKQIHLNNILDCLVCWWPWPTSSVASGLDRELSTWLIINQSPYISLSKWLAGVPQNTFFFFKQCARVPNVI